MSLGLVLPSISPIARIVSDNLLFSFPFLKKKKKRKTVVLRNLILALVAVIDAGHMYYIPLNCRKKLNSQNAPGSQKCQLILPLIHDRNARKSKGFLILSVKNVFQTKLTISIEEDIIGTEIDAAIARSRDAAQGT